MGARGDRTPESPGVTSHLSKILEGGTPLVSVPPLKSGECSPDIFYRLPDVFQISTPVASEYVSKGKLGYP